MALVDDVLVTCSGYETCSRWTYSSRSWERLWQAINVCPPTNSTLWLTSLQINQNPRPPSTNLNTLLARSQFFNMTSEFYTIQNL